MKQMDIFKSELDMQFHKLSVSFARVQVADNTDEDQDQTNILFMLSLNLCHQYINTLPHNPDL